MTVLIKLNDNVNKINDNVNNGCEEDKKRAGTEEGCDQKGRE